MKKRSDYFEGRDLCIATKHQKEKVLAPLLEAALGVHVFVPSSLDTDVLGTFSGSVKREKNPLETARDKCRLANELVGCDLVLASEGSFGNHPTLFFTQADEEILLLKDFKNDIEIAAKSLSTSTNLNSAIIDNQKELLVFAEEIGFPEHGVVMRRSEDDYSEVYMDLFSQEELVDRFKKLKTNTDSVFVETDMRAMNNPKRMEVIREAGVELLKRIESQCPSCALPGFWISKVNPGLPCSQCGFPTRSSLSYTYSCVKCEHTEKKMFPRDIRFEDPMYCDICNP